MAIKQLTLLGSSVKRIAGYNNLVYHFTEAGVDVHNLLGERLAYAALANVTCGAVNSNGVYLGTSSGGVYKLTHAAIAAGGDQTSALAQAITTATTPAIASNAVAGMDGTGTALIVSTAAGVDFLPDASTVYSYTDANGCGACALNATEIAYILASGAVHRLDHPTADWSSGGVTVYTGEESVKTLNYLSVPDQTHAYAYKLFWSPSGTYLFFCNGDGNTSLWRYTRSGSALTKTGEYATHSFGFGGGSISDDGTLIAVADYNSPYISWYSVSGSAITKLTDPASALPTTGRTPVWCPDDNQYLAVCYPTGSGGAGLRMYKRSGTTALNALTEPTAPGGNVYRGQWNGNYLIVGHENAPYLTLYRRDGDTLTKLPGTGIDHAGACHRMAWNGNFLAAAQFGTYAIVMYEFDPVTETFTKLTGFDGTLASYVGALAWHNSGTLLAAMINVYPWLHLYEFDGDELTLVTSTDGGVLTEVSFSIAWYGDYLAVMQSTTPSGEGVRLFSLSEEGGGGLLNLATSLAFGTDLFVGSDDGIDVLGSSTRAIASPDGKPVKTIAPTPTATTATGILAYGTNDGQDGGQFGAIDLSA